MKGNLSLKFKNVLVTGGGGFIGGNFIRKIINIDGINVFNIDKVNYCTDEKSLNEFENNFKKKYSFFRIDLNQFDKVQEIINIAKPDLVVHFAAESHVDKSIKNPLSFIQSNIVGTFNLLEATKKYWSKLSISKKEKFRFLHISTDEVYGSLGNVGKFIETSPYRPNSPYSSSKAASDHLVRSWHKTYGLPTLITNCSNNYGPWQFPEKLIPLTIKNILNNKKIPVYGDGSQKRDWLFIEDHINALIKVVNKSRIGKNYCIGGGKDIKNIDLINLICEKMDKLLDRKVSSKKLINYVEDRLGHDYRYSIDYSLIKKDIGWEPTTSFEEGIDITINWYLSNKDWMNN